MEENEKMKIGDIVKTIEDTIHLLSEELIRIKQIDNKRFEEMQEKLDQVVLGSRNRSLSAFEIVDLLMKLQNDTITFLDTTLYKENSSDLNTIHNSEEKIADMQLYVPPKKSFWEKIGERFLSIKKVASSLGLNEASIENTNTINQIAQMVSQNYERTDEEGYTEDFRKLVYDFFKETKEHIRIGYR